MKIIHFALLLVMSVSWWQCDFINPEEGIPSYLFIEEFTLTTGPAQGSNSHKITEAWVFVDDIFLGVYDLPATVPVLETGSHTVRVEAGIRDNGLGDFPNIYPFSPTF
ncbi:MAG: hypothetical protein R2795_07325 [Saprospiraceae bacterium]